MTLNFLIILSLIQGITEFLPISSSAHLILIPYFTQNVYEGRGFDVCLHFGCLIAIIIYLKNDFKNYIRPLTIHPKKKFTREGICIFIGSVISSVCVKNNSILFFPFISEEHLFLLKS